MIRSSSALAAADVASALLGADLVGELREVAQHVPVQVAADAVSLARGLRADVLVTVGGGSATGLAKAVAALFDFATRVGAPTSLARLGLSHHAIEEVVATVTASDVANPTADHATGPRGHPA